MWVWIMPNRKHRFAWKDHMRNWGNGFYSECAGCRANAVICWFCGKQGTWESWWRPISTSEVLRGDTHGRSPDGSCWRNSSSNQASRSHLADTGKHKTGRTSVSLNFNFKSLNFYWILAHKGKIIWFWNSLLWRLNIFGFELLWHFILQIWFLYKNLLMGKSKPAHWGPVIGILWLEYVSPVIWYHCRISEEVLKNI